MGVFKGYPRSKTRDMEVPATTGGATRAFDKNPGFRGRTKVPVARGTNTVEKMSRGPIPNRKG